MQDDNAQFCCWHLQCHCADKGLSGQFIFTEVENNTAAVVLIVDENDDGVVEVVIIINIMKIVKLPIYGGVASSPEAAALDNDIF